MNKIQKVFLDNEVVSLSHFMSLSGVGTATVVNCYKFQNVDMIDLNSPTIPTSCLVNLPSTRLGFTKRIAMTNGNPMGVSMSEDSKGKIVAGALAPHPPHLVYAQNPPQK